MCRVLEVVRISYYAWARKSPLSRYNPEVRQIAQDAFTQSRGSIGSRRMSHVLKKAGYPVGRYQARSIMRSLGLEVKRKRKFMITTVANPKNSVADNILNRNFRPVLPNESWSADITYISTKEGWLYLSIVMDLFSRRLVGWKASNRMDANLVIIPLMKAAKDRKPPTTLIFHSDRGCQYTCLKTQKAIKCLGITQSMSRKGNCWDNAPTERFFASFKSEWMPRSGYETREDAEKDITEYIVGYYNSTRLHSALGYMSPMEYEHVS